MRALGLKGGFWAWQGKEGVTGTGVTGERGGKARFFTCFCQGNCKRGAEDLFFYIFSFLL